MTDPIWTPLKLLSWTQDYFARNGVDAPRLTAEVLLAHALGCDRIRLYMDFDKPLGPTELGAFRALVKRRAGGEPTAYVVGSREFYGRRFKTDARALIPRPETELLVEAALGALPEGGSALDLCTGSGCVAVSIALERPSARVVGVDLSPDALALARENADALGAHDVELLEGDLYAPVGQRPPFHVIAANPPYVPSPEVPNLARELSFEPALALDGGDAGLTVMRPLISGAAARLVPGGLLAVEIHESHATVLPALCAKAGLVGAEVRPDLAGLPRLLVARAP